MRRAFTILFAVGLAIGACGSETVEAVSVSGTEVCTEVDTQGDELSRYRCVETLDDARVSGTAIVTLTMLDESVSPIVDAGEFMLENDGGSWSGEWSGVIEEDGLHTIDGVLLGSGGYDGLQYRARWVFTTTSDGEVTGTIEPSP
ncbi:MAG: hypothetical protein HKN24_14375 [Acidimicrobiales bacterium]|nr:hypothetical protein [Acidimicrobiales bacterium]